MVDDRRDVAHVRQRINFKSLYINLFFLIKITLFLKLDEILIPNLTYMLIPSKPSLDDFLPQMKRL
jgi:hypothetical protein